MERLTQDGVDYCKDICGGVCAFNDIYDDDWNCPEREYYNKLREYEKVGLEPEVIKNCLLTQELIDSGITPAIIGTPLTHLLELAKAEAEGHLEVLPCKVGDTVYVIERDIMGIKRIYNARVNGISVQYDGEAILHFGDSMHSMYHPASQCASGIGKTVFHTREEAETVLKEGTT